MGLTRAQSDFYEQNGYVVVENLVSRDTLSDIRQRVDDIQNTILEAQAAARARAASANPGTSGGKQVSYIVENSGGTAVATRPSLRKLADLAPMDAYFRSVASTPEILQCVSDCTGGGPKIMLYSDQVFLK